MPSVSHFLNVCSWATRLMAGEMYIRIIDGWWPALLHPLGETANANYVWK